MPMANLAYEVAIYGSSSTGLGSKCSDVDLTVIFNDPASETCMVEIMRFLSDALSNDLACTSVVPILAAKVPVVKCAFGDADVDVTMNNRLAKLNSMLLRSYARVNSRVRDLCCLVKQWAKDAELVSSPVPRQCVASCPSAANIKPPRPVSYKVQ